MITTQALNLIISNPLEQFEIKEFIFFGSPLLGMKLSLTNLGFYLILVTVLIFGMSFLATNNYKVIANRWSITQESLYGSIYSMVNSSIGPKGEVFIPFIYSLFIYILMSNLIGLIPYSFTPTSQVITCLGFSVTILLGVTILGFQIHGLHFLGFFVPSGTPLGLVPVLVVIEFISYLARSVSLGVRLFANMVAGHVLLKIISTFSWKFIVSGTIGLVLGILPLIFIVLLYGLEIGVALIQGYVFAMLTCSYINDAINMH